MEKNTQKHQPVNSNSANFNTIGAKFKNAKAKVSAPKTKKYTDCTNLKSEEGACSTESSTSCEAAKLSGSNHQVQDVNNSISTHQPLNTYKDVNNTDSMSFVTDEVAVKVNKRTWVNTSGYVAKGVTPTPKQVDTDSIAKTRKLLDGAIAYAWSQVKSKRRPPALTPTRWVWRLAGSYHLCRFTPQLMEEAAQRFAASDCESLANWALEKASEERGHDRLALLDIQSMGYQADAVVEALVPPAAEALVNYFIRSVWRLDPISSVGYSYTMERLALGVGEKYIQQVEALLPPGINTTRCLRVHSSVGADAEHVEETVEMLARISHEEVTRVVNACYETALLCFSPPKQNYISDEELHRVLKPLEYVKNCG
jgi:hypothetical protein